MAAGYSGTPLAKKLGLKDGFHIKIVNAPNGYWQLFDQLPELKEPARKPYDFVHMFCTDARKLERELPKLMDQIVRHGMIWISWPKKASGVKTNVSEDTIRAVCLPLGLVDVKVCAIDETWSGLKLVIRTELR